MCMTTKDLVRGVLRVEWGYAGAMALKTEKLSLREILTVVVAIGVIFGQAASIPSLNQ